MPNPLGSVTLNVTTSSLYDSLYTGPEPLAGLDYVVGGHVVPLPGDGGLEALNTTVRGRYLL